jgi:hypothetical protein
MEIPLKVGRFFTSSDRTAAPLPVIINEAFMRVFLRTPNPVGTSIRIGGDRRPAQIVGVVGDIKGDNLMAPALAMLFMPYSQPTRATTFEIRADNLETTLPSIRALVRRIDPQLLLNGLTSHKAATELRLMGDQVVLAPSMRVIAGLALIISMIGLFGLMSYSVARRTREIGIRMAIGAQPQTVLLAVLRETQALVAVGIGTGIALALTLTPVLEMQWFGLTPHDPKTIAGVSLLMVIVSCMAGYFPARRASQVDPMISLRDN